MSAEAVEYTRDNGATKMVVKVKKEVILAGGTIGSPAVLLHSGIGPKDVLSSAGVMLVQELPGVGQHLQDHLVSFPHVHLKESMLIQTERHNSIQHGPGNGWFALRCKWIRNSLSAPEPLGDLIC